MSHASAQIVREEQPDDTRHPRWTVQVCRVHIYLRQNTTGMTYGHLDSAFVRAGAIYRRNGVYVCTIKGIAETEVIVDIDRIKVMRGIFLLNFIL